MNDNCISLPWNGFSKAGAEAGVAFTINDGLLDFSISLGEKRTNILLTQISFKSD